MQNSNRNQSDSQYTNTNAVPVANERIPIRNSNLTVERESSLRSTTLQPSPNGSLAKYTNPTLAVLRSDSVVTIIIILAGMIVTFVVLRLLISFRRRLKATRRYQAIVAAKNSLFDLLTDAADPRTAHAVGIGVSEFGEKVLHVFIGEDDSERASQIPTEITTSQAEIIPVVKVKMPRAKALTGRTTPLQDLARQSHDTLIGGISASHSSLDGWGTLGFLCRKRNRRNANLRGRNERVYLLSNAHVFNSNCAIEVTAVNAPGIQVHQCSPGENSGRPVALLAESKAIAFASEATPNLVDAAIAKKFDRIRFSPEIASLGRVKGHLKADTVAAGSPCQKFGRTTAHTKGKIYSTQVDIWVYYPDLNESAFFKDQIIIVPESGQFADEGDSGSPVLDMNGYAIGLLFAGSDGTRADMDEPPLPLHPESGYGVANPIEVVLETFDLELCT